MELICSNCGTTIRAENVNIATDMAKCESCNSLHRASSLKERVHLADLLVLPTDTRLQLQQGRANSIEIILPPTGLDGAVIGLFIFSIFWLGFITVWTVFASMGSIFFALFSIPFWIVGIFMLRGAINRSRERQQITMNNHEVILEIIKPMGGKKTVIPRSEVASVEMTSILNGLDALKSIEYAQVSNSTKVGNKKADFPTIITTTKKKHYFFQSLTVPEKEWAVKLMNHILVG